MMKKNCSGSTQAGILVILHTSIGICKICNICDNITIASAYSAYFDIYVIFCIYNLNAIYPQVVIFDRDILY